MDTLKTRLKELIQLKESLIRKGDKVRISPAYPLKQFAGREFTVDVRIRIPDAVVVAGKIIFIQWVQKV